MARNKIISKEARQYVIDQLHEHGEMTKSEVMDLVRPHCSFDPITLREQALGRLVSGIIHSVRDASGIRSAFIVRGADNVIDIDTCKSLPNISAVECQLAKQLDGIRASHRKAERRKQELEGQMDIFATAQ